MTENAASNLADKELETTLDELPVLLRGDRAHPDLEGELMRRHDKAEQQLKNVAEYANTDEEKALVEQIENSWERYKTLWSNRPGEASEKERELFDRRLALFLEEDLLRRCSNLLEYNTRQVKESSDADHRLVERLTWGLLTVGIGAPLVGLLLGYAVARRLHQSMLQLSVRIRDAAGRLNSELEPFQVGSDLDVTALHRQMQVISEEIERVFERLRQREREVLRAEQLSAVGQVAAGVAHELRNPLTSVKMLVQTGLEGTPPSGLPAEDLQIIEKEIRRMEACIQTFLDFARPPTAERRQTDLLAVVHRAVSLLEGRARRQHVDIQTDLPQTPLELLLDPEQIHQVFVNLLLNALDAMPRGGELRLEIRPTTDPPGARVRIRDTGTGIPAPVLARLFDPFVSGKETGIGLGLSICRRLLEEHGGSITGENDPHGGALFTFTLPK